MNNSTTREIFLNKLKRTGELQITVTGRKTKKKFSTPVWFVLDGDNKRVTIVPVKGADSNWFKNLAKDPSIELALGDSTISSKASLVRDSNQTKQVIEKLKAKYKLEWSESYYTKRDAFIEVPV